MLDDDVDLIRLAFVSAIAELCGGITVKKPIMQRRKPLFILEVCEWQNWLAEKIVITRLFPSLFREI